MTTDDVCADFARKGVKITVKLLPQDPGAVLIEGDRTAFEFLSRLFAAHAAGGDCGFEIGPNYAGHAFFSGESQLGLYLHCLPCQNSHEPNRS